MQNFIWSKNEEYKKSKKEDKPITNENNEIVHNVLYRGEQINKKKFIEENLENNKKIKEINERTFTTRGYLNPFLNKNYNDVNIKDLDQINDIILDLKNDYENKWKSLNEINTSIILPIR